MSFFRAEYGEPIVLAEATATEGKEVFIPRYPSKLSQIHDDIMGRWLRRSVRVNDYRRPLRRDVLSRLARWLGRRLVAWGTRP